MVHKILTRAEVADIVRAHMIGHGQIPHENITQRMDSRLESTESEPSSWDEAHVNGLDPAMIFEWEEHPPSGPYR